MGHDPEIADSEVQGNDRYLPDAAATLDVACLSCRIHRDGKKEEIMETVRAAFRREGFVRVQDGRVLGGVIAGLGRRFGIDPWPARLLFVVLLMLIPGSQLLIYPILWIMMPSDVGASTAVATGASGPKSPSR